MLDEKLNDLKTDAKASRVEILELLNKIKDVAKTPILMPCGIKLRRALSSKYGSKIQLEIWLLLLSN